MIRINTPYNKAVYLSRLNTNSNISETHKAELRKNLDLLIKLDFGTF